MLSTLNVDQLRGRRFERTAQNILNTNQSYDLIHQPFRAENQNNPFSILDTDTYMASKKRGVSNTPSKEEYAEILKNQIREKDAAKRQLLEQDRKYDYSQLRTNIFSQPSFQTNSQSLLEGLIPKFSQINLKDQDLKVRNQNIFSINQTSNASTTNNTLLEKNKSELLKLFSNQNYVYLKDIQQVQQNTSFLSNEKNAKKNPSSVQAIKLTNSILSGESRVESQAQNASYARNYKASLGFGNLDPEVEEAKLKKKMEFNQALQEQIEQNKIRKFEQRKDEMLTDIKEEEKIKKQTFEERWEYLAANPSERKVINANRNLLERRLELENEQKKSDVRRKLYLPTFEQDKKQQNNKSPSPIKPESNIYSRELDQYLSIKYPAAYSKDEIFLKDVSYLPNRYPSVAGKINSGHMELDIKKSEFYKTQAAVLEQLENLKKDLSTSEQSRYRSQAELNTLKKRVQKRNSVDESLYSDNLDNELRTSYKSPVKSARKGSVGDIPYTISPIEDSRNGNSNSKFYTKVHDLAFPSMKFDKEAHIKEGLDKKRWELEMNEIDADSKMISAKQNWRNIMENNVEDNFNSYLRREDEKRQALIRNLEGKFNEAEKIDPSQDNRPINSGAQKKRVSKQQKGSEENEEEGAVKLENLGQIEEAEEAVTKSVVVEEDDQNGRIEKNQIESNEGYQEIPKQDEIIVNNDSQGDENKNNIINQYDSTLVKEDPDVSKELDVYEETNPMIKQYNNNSILENLSNIERALHDGATRGLLPEELSVVEKFYLSKYGTEQDDDVMSVLYNIQSILQKTSREYLQKEKDGDEIDPEREEIKLKYGYEKVKRKQGKPIADSSYPIVSKLSETHSVTDESHNFSTKNFQGRDFQSNVRPSQMDNPNPSEFDHTIRSDFIETERGFLNTDTINSINVHTNEYSLGRSPDKSFGDTGTSQRYAQSSFGGKNLYKREGIEEDVEEELANLDILVEKFRRD